MDPCTTLAHYLDHRTCLDLPTFQWKSFSNLIFFSNLGVNPIEKDIVLGMLQRALNKFYLCMESLFLLNIMKMDRGISFKTTF